jgi:hypothetical protein
MAPGTQTTPVRFRRLQTMKYKNSGNPSVSVEVISDDVEIRIGETKWAGVVYTREGKSKVYVRTKAEFKAKFTPASGDKP